MLNLTHQERWVILFLITVALVGLGINFLVKKNSQVIVISYLNQDIGKIDINEADIDTLKGIKGVGEKLAKEIISYRNQRGGFKDIEELKNIKGIGKSKYEAIKDYFNEPTTSQNQE